MAVQEQTPLQEYTANGITTQFDLEFDCESADHLIVSIDDLEVLHTDWYLSGNAIMFHVAPANGKQVKIQRNTPFNRISDYQSYNNSFRPPAINKDFDRIWWKLQELGVADWILHNRIDALKAYVDDRDDELRAYLMEEIRKQGVALDQLDEYYNYLMQRLAQIAVDKGWDASFVVDGNKNQHEINQEQLTENEAIRSDITKVESYIVYAEKYGSSLNEAMIAINLEFISKRVRVYVPSNFPVTAAVNLDIDCDLSMTSLQVMNDVDVIFKPATGWNGTSTECDVFCNNKSIRLGWDLLDDLGYITINKTTFYDVGNESLNTSASYFTAFLINNHNIKKLDLFNPGTINSYVKPNGTEGDSAGSNRSIEIVGFLNTGDFASDINIFYPYAKNLKTGEDSDGLVINCGQGTQTNPVFNIDIYGGQFFEMGKRAVKIIGTSKKASGIRFHENMVGTGAGSFPWAGVEVSGEVAVEWNGTAIMKGFITDFNIWGGAYVTGNAHFVAMKSDTLNISGNSTRGFNSDNGSTPSARKCIVDIASLTVTRGYESIRIREGQNIKIKSVTVEVTQRIWTVDASTLNIGELNIKFVDPLVTPVPALTIPSTLAGITGAVTCKFNKLDVNFTQTYAPVNYLFFLSGVSGFEVDELIVKGNISAAPVLSSNSSNIKIRNGKTSSKFIASVTGGANLLLSQCKAGWGGLLENNATTPMTNVIEINTLTF